MASNTPPLPSLILDCTTGTNQRRCMELMESIKSKLYDTYTNDIKVKENARKIGKYLFGGGVERYYF